MFRLVEWLIIGCLILGSGFAGVATFHLLLLGWSRQRWGVVGTHLLMLFGWLATLAVCVVAGFMQSLEEGILVALVVVFFTLLATLGGSQQWRKA
jgi:hypothetical protein